jgi:hypothetical protein
MSFTVPLPPAHSFIIGPAVINTHTHILIDLERQVLDFFLSASKPTRIKSITYV